MRSLALVPLVLTLAVTACTSGATRPEPAPQLSATDASAPSPQSVNKTPVMMVPGADGELKPAANAELIPPDEELVDAMTCEPISEENARTVHDAIGASTSNAVQVKIGQPSGDATFYAVVVPGRPSEWDAREHLPLVVGDDHFYSLGALMRGPVPGGWNYAWDLIYWDAAGLQRGQSALAKAFDCLGADRYQTEGATLRD